MLQLWFKCYEIRRCYALQCLTVEQLEELNCWVIHSVGICLPMVKEGANLEHWSATRVV